MQIKSEKIELVKTDILKYHPKNTNKHPKEQIERLKSLIEYQGFRVPLIVEAGTNLVVSGNGRLEAARSLGLGTVPVIYENFESEEQLFAFLTSDNAIASWAELDLSAINQEMLDLGPDFNIDLLGIKDFVIEPVEKFEPQSDEDTVPEVKHDPITKRGDIWLLGNHRVMCGDSTMIDDVEKLMNGEKADMVFTDPPYNINLKPKRGTHGKIKNDNMSESDFSEFLYNVFANCQAVTKIDTYLISFMGWSTISNFEKALKDCLYEIKSMPIWKKNNFGIGYYTRPQYEPFYLCLKGNPAKPDRAPSDVFEFSKVYKTIHSCEKPVDMITSIVDTFKGGELLYEPFCGSGSTLIACEKTNRKCYGMELDEHYCDVIIKRWQDYTGKEAILESTKQTYNSMVTQ